MLKRLTLFTPTHRKYTVDFSSSVTTLTVVKFERKRNPTECVTTSSPPPKSRAGEVTHNLTDVLMERGLNRV